MNSPTTPTNPFERFLIEDVEQAIHIRFEQQVARYPNRIAIRTRDQELTYEQLNEFSNRIARTLTERLGNSAEPVALLFHQGINAIAATLGILKAGKFYVPLDPSHPPRTITKMLESSKATLIVSDGPNFALAKTLAGKNTRVIDVEQIDQTLPLDNLEFPVSADALAYIYFTSGSTGTPKGVMDNHRNVLHNVRRYTNSLHIAQNDRLSLLQSCVFSGTVSSLFGALSNGASVVAIDLPKETSASLAKLLHHRKVSIYHSVPTIFRSFLQNDGLRFPHIRIVRLEGDQASGMDVKLFKQHFGQDCILVNGLGATETGLVSQYFVNQDSPIPAAALPIGFPVQDMDIQLLNEAGETVPSGTVAEIAIRSKHLAVGYWEMPDLTKQAFVTDVQDSEFRTYHTGDLGRKSEDGCIEYMGRKDSRVKVRGQMVDVAEVESALLELDSVHEAVVSTIDNESSGKRLVAFLVPSNSDLPAVSQLRQYMGKLLPDYMVPSKYVTLEAMPLTGNGKIDRRALSIIPATRPELDVPFLPPKTTTQSRIQKIWEELLEITPIGIKDDFVELGGDSLLAISMIDQVDREFGIEIPISVLASKASVESLAEVILNKEINYLIPFTDVQQDARNPPFYYLHGNYLDGGWNCRQFAPFLRQDTPIFAMPPSGSDGQPVLESYQKMASYHLEKLQAFHKGGPYLLGGHCNGGLVALEMARQLKKQGENVGPLVLIAASASNLRFKRMLKQLKRIDGITSSNPGLWFLAFLLFRKGIILSDKRSGMEWIRHLLFILPKVPGNLASHWRTTIHEQKIPVESQEGVGMVRDPEKARQALTAIYQRIDKLYLPEPYDGPMTILWPEGEPESAAEAEKYWREVSNDIQFRVIPGDHVTCRSTYAEIYARELQACLDVHNDKVNPHIAETTEASQPAISPKL
jgi:amino acid adenylation domain-containing protein